MFIKQKRGFLKTKFILIFLVAFYVSLFQFSFATQIRIRIRPNDTGLTGSGSKTLEYRIMQPFLSCSSALPDVFSNLGDNNTPSTNRPGNNNFLRQPQIPL